MDFTTLRTLIPEQFECIVDELLSTKANVDEGFMIKRHSDLNAFIDESIRYCESRVPEACGRTEGAELNRLFKKYIA